MQLITSLSPGTPTYSHLDGVSQRFLRKNYKYRQLGTEINETKEMSENVVLYCLANSINVAAKFKFPQLAITL